jgi:NADH-quinone oxidoreductase subunit C
MDIKQLVEEKVKNQFPNFQIEFSEYLGELCFKVSKDNIVEICSFLKNDEDLKFLLSEDITAVDWATRKNRFTVVYHIFSLKNNFRLKIKVDVDESDCSIDSVTSVWRAANWQERECYDMYGIIFKNHPDLRRMYMPEEFEYYPLRKDFPLMGIPGSLPLPKK